MKRALAFAAAVGAALAAGPSGVSAADGSAAVTFNQDIAPILHQRCAGCHRPGQAAPFSLLTFQDAAKRAALIRAVTTSRYMPPWHAEPGYGKFQGERRLEDAEVALIAEWVDSGAPQGGGPAPQPPRFPANWPLGEPDLVVRMEQPFSVPADGPDIYRNFPARMGTTEDKWVRAIDFRPQARTVVHHSLFKADPTGKTARKYDAKDDTPGYDGMAGGPIPGKVSLSGWAVGGNARVFHPEAPIKLPAGSDFIFESHFHPSGKAESEVSTAALYFTDKPATRSRLSIDLPPKFGRGAGIDIQPGDASFTISESFTLPAAVELYSATPHAHYVGKEFKGWAELPDGSEVPLIWIKDWDFAWQDMYVYEKPVVLPAGTTIRARIRYDNSAGNPRNPSSPPKRVWWGTGSADEMGTIIFSGMPVDESDKQVLRVAIRKLEAEHAAQAKREAKRRREARRQASAQLGR